MTVTFPHTTRAIEATIGDDTCPVCHGVGRIADGDDVDYCDEPGCSAWQVQPPLSLCCHGHTDLNTPCPDCAREHERWRGMSIRRRLGHPEYRAQQVRHQEWAATVLPLLPESIKARLRADLFGA